MYSTTVGYAGGYTLNLSYEEVYTRRTSYAEVMRMVFDLTVISYAALLAVFWEPHDLTQGIRQCNGIGTQYRSAIHSYGPEQQALAETPPDPRIRRLCAPPATVDYHGNPACATVLLCQRSITNSI